MTARVLKRLEEHEKKVIRRNRIIMKCSAASVGICAAILLCIGIKSIEKVPRSSFDGDIIVSEDVEQTTASDDIRTATNRETQTASETIYVTQTTEIARTSTTVHQTARTTIAVSTSSAEITKITEPATEPETSDIGQVESDVLTVGELTFEQVCEYFPVVNRNGTAYHCIGTTTEITCVTTASLITVAPTGNGDTPVETAYAEVAECDGFIAVRFVGRNEYIIYQ